MKFDLYYMLSPQKPTQRQEIEEQFRMFFSSDWQLTCIDGNDHVETLRAAIELDSHLVIAESGTQFNARTRNVIERGVTSLAGRAWDAMYTEVSFTEERYIESFPPVAQMLELNNLEIRYLEKVNYTGARCYIINKWSKYKFYELVQTYSSQTEPYDIFLRNLVHQRSLQACVLYPFATKSEQSPLQAVETPPQEVDAPKQPSVVPDRQPVAQTQMRIVFTRLDAIGDLICSTAAIRAARKSWPHAKISLVCNQYNAAVMKHSTDIDELEIVRKNNSEDLANAAIKFKGVDIAIALAPRLEDVLFVCATSAKQRIGYTQLDFNAGVLIKYNLTQTLVPSAYPAVYDPRPEHFVFHEVEQGLHLVAAAGGDISDPQISLALHADDHAAVAHVPENCILVPLGPRWFREGSSEKSVRLLLKGLRRFQRPIVVTHNEHCAAAAEGIISDGLADVVLGNMSFTHWAAVFPKAACILTVDSSATHIASAFKRPTVILFEHGWFYIQRQKWAPYKTPSVILRKPFEENEATLESSREEMLNAVARLLEETSSPHL